MENIVEAIIEIPMGTKNKFEVNKKTGKIKLDRVLYSSMSYPGEYGYIDETLSYDGDPLDVLIINSFLIFLILFIVFLLTRARIIFISNY